MKKEDESYESAKSNTTVTKPGWLLYYILETYQLNRFRENKKKSISGKT